MAYEPRLAYWRATDVLVPEISATRPVLCSFRDLVALRTFAYLRGERSLQSIRRALRTLVDIGETEHLSGYRLVAQPGQALTVVKLGDVLRSFPLGDVEVPNLGHPRRHVSVDAAGARDAYDFAEYVRRAA